LFEEKGGILGKLQIGAVYRYGRPYSAVNAIEDGLPNYFFETHTPGHNMALLEKGISPISAIDQDGEKRIVAVLVSSSPHKVGSESTPWQDVFDIERGLVRYSGDNKTSDYTSLAPGNQILLDQFRFHTSPYSRERKLAVPILFFERVEMSGRKKGNVRFQGVGIIQSIELMTQFQKSIGDFPNYVFEFSMLSLSEENFTFDWNWISARRESGNSLSLADSLAPKAFRDWINIGQPTLIKKSSFD
jgi:hypothetical protein